MKGDEYNIIIIHDNVEYVIQCNELLQRIYGTTNIDDIPDTAPTMEDKIMDMISKRLKVLWIPTSENSLGTIRNHVRKFIVSQYKKD